MPKSKTIIGIDPGASGVVITKSYWDGKKVVVEQIDEIDFYLPMDAVRGDDGVWRTEDPA